jgi:hypothetical protein
VQGFFAKVPRAIVTLLRIDVQQNLDIIRFNVQKILDKTKFKETASFVIDFGQFFRFP